MEFSPSQPPVSDSLPYPLLNLFFFPLGLLVFSTVMLLCFLCCRFLVCCIESIDPDIEYGVSSSRPPPTTPFRLRNLLVPVQPRGPQVAASASVQFSGKAQSSGMVAGSCVFVYQSDVVLENVGKLLEECAICFEDFADGEECKVINECNHGYHKACVDEWLKIQNQCPLCRRDVGGTSFRVRETIQEVV